MGKSPEEGIKAPVKTSSTVNLVLSGTGQVLNGITTGTGDRVLVKDQTAPQFNGTYKVGPDAWERTTDMNAADDLANGQLIVDSNTFVVYSISYTGAWSPDITALDFIVLIAGMPQSIILTAAFPIDLVDHNVALVTGSTDPSVNQHLEYDLESIQSKSDDTTPAPLYLNRLGSYVQIPQIIAGNPGTEAGGITIGGVTYQSALKTSDIGGTNRAAFIVHRHSTTLPAVIVGARSNSDDATHVIVADNDTLLSIMAVGWDGNEYEQGAQIRFQVDGTPGVDDMPGRIVFLTTPAGADIPVERLRISADGTILMAKDLIVNGDQGITISADIPRFNMVDNNTALDQGTWRSSLNGFRILTDDLTVGYPFMNWTRSGTGAGIQVDDLLFTAAVSVTVDAPDLAVTGTVDGVDIDAFSTAMGMHVGDGTIHFTMGAISIPASQISDFASAVAANAAVAANTAKISYTDAAAVGLNTAKLTNVPTALSIGTHAIGTLGITSDSGADDVVLPSFTATLSGVIPGSGGGTTNFMRADGTWAAPAGGGNVSNVATPLINQIGVWTGATTLAGTVGLILDSTFKYRLKVGDGAKLKT
jgi:hypothetical protein